MKRYLLMGCTYIIIISLLCVFPITAFAAGNSPVIRVGIPLQDGFGEVTENGKYAGYAFEYINEIAKYTGWNYTFVTGEQNKLQTMLEKGEIDLLGGVRKDDITSQKFLFPEYNCGTTYATLCTTQTNMKFSRSDPSTFQNMRVAVVQDNSSRISKLLHYCIANNITVQTVNYASYQDALSSLSRGSVEGILLGDIPNIDGLKILAQFPADPYFFAANEKHPELVKGINQTVPRIKEVNPDFDTTLYQKYFPLNEKLFFLSESELEYIKSLKTIRVVSGANTVPVDYFEHGKYNGITKDILTMISESTGIQFEYIPTNTQQEAYALLREGKADIVTNVFDDAYFNSDRDISTTNPYLTAPLMVIKRTEIPFDEIGVGTVKLGIVNNRVLIDTLRVGNTTYYDSVRDCVEGVLKDEVKYCYIGAYSMRYYTQLLGADNVDIIPSVNTDQSYCFGMKKPIDVTLMTILNKAILNITDEEKQHIVFTNMNITVPLTVSAILRKNLHLVITGILFIIAVVLLLIALQSRKKRKVQQEFFQRYSILSDLMQETLFEYDYKTDEVNISNRHASRLGIPPVIKDFSRTIQTGNINIMDEDLDEIKYLNIMPSQKEYAVELRMIFPSGIKWYRASFVVLWDSHAKPTKAIGKLCNINREKREKERLVNMAQRDALTGLYNKATMTMLSENYLKNTNEDLSSALLIIDVDDFKTINDTYGHKAGDEALKHIAKILATPFRSTDILGRIGGDEFAILVKEIPTTDWLEDRCKEILSKFQTPHDNCGEILTYSCSIGIAVFPKDGHTYDELFQSADAALYLVKRKGKTGFAYFNENALPELKLEEISKSCS